MINVGLTGGIGSGKSTVCTLFKMLGIPVYISDIRAYLLMIHNLEIIKALKTSFGNDIYLQNGMINKEKLTKLVFKSPETRTIINSIVHPAVAIDFSQWCTMQDETAPYLLQESALLFESGQWEMHDKIITVTCPLEERIVRLQKRDRCTETEAREKIASQMPEEEKAAKSNFHIESGSNNLVIQKVLDIHKQLITT